MACGRVSRRSQLAATVSAGRWKLPTALPGKTHPPKTRPTPGAAATSGAEQGREDTPVRPGSAAAPGALLSISACGMRTGTRRAPTTPSPPAPAPWKAPNTAPRVRCQTSPRSARQTGGVRAHLRAEPRQSSSRSIVAAGQDGEGRRSPPRPQPGCGRWPTRGTALLLPQTPRSCAQAGSHGGHTAITPGLPATGAVGAWPRAALALPGNTMFCSVSSNFNLVLLEATEPWMPNAII